MRAVPRGTTGSARRRRSKVARGSEQRQAPRPCPGPGNPRPIAPPPRPTNGPTRPGPGRPRAARRGGDPREEDRRPRCKAFLPIGPGDGAAPRGGFRARPRATRSRGGLLERGDPKVLAQAPAEPALYGPHGTRSSAGPAAYGTRAVAPPPLGGREPGPERAPAPPGRGPRRPPRLAPPPQPSSHAPLPLHLDLLHAARLVQGRAPGHCRAGQRTEELPPAPTRRRRPPSRPPRSHGRRSAPRACSGRGTLRRSRRRAGRPRCPRARSPSERSRARTKPPSFAVAAIVAEFAVSSARSRSWLSRCHSQIVRAPSAPSGPRPGCRACRAPSPRGRGRPPTARANRRRSSSTGDPLAGRSRARVVVRPARPAPSTTTSVSCFPRSGEGRGGAATRPRRL